MPKQRTSRNQVEDILKAINTKDTEYRLVPHEKLGKNTTYYTYSIVVRFNGGRWENTYIQKATLKEAYNYANGLLFQEE